MTCFVSHTTIDCTNAYELSEWWKRLLGYVDLADDPNGPGDEECTIVDPETGHDLLFLEVPDRKQVKNRIHLDLRPREGTRDEEVERVRALGATVVADRRTPDGMGWVVFADPEGNEFCVLRSVQERAAHGPITGVLVTGRQEAAGFVSVSWVHDQLREWLGVDPFPGTLNLELRDPASHAAWQHRSAEGKGLLLPPGESGYCPAHYFPVLIEGIRAGIVRPDVDGYPTDVVEVVAGERLRDRLGLADGDEVTLTWPDDEA